MKVVGIIPVRLESTRLPGKALKDISGLPAIVHVYKRCLLSKGLDEVYVATNSEDIRHCVEAYGGRVLMTGSHRNGSERIYEALKNIEADIIINIQGDEVLVHPDHIGAIVREMIEDDTIHYCVGVTPFNKISSPHDFKAVVDLKGNMLYCSREDIPSSSITGNDNRLKVVFIVGFRKDSLKQFVEWSATPLEQREPNEFLRILEHGDKIRTVEVKGAQISLDTENDLGEIREIIKKDEIARLY